MLVTQLSNCTYKIDMTEEELHHFRIIAIGTENKFVSGVESLLAYILTWTEQHWYDTIPEPPLVPLNDLKKDETDGYSAPK